jgi:hypothetical protein
MILITYRSVVVDPRLFFSDPDPIFVQVLDLDSDPDPLWLVKSYEPVSDPTLNVFFFLNVIIIKWLIFLMIFRWFLIRCIYRYCFGSGSESITLSTGNGSGSCIKFQILTDSDPDPQHWHTGTPMSRPHDLGPNREERSRNMSGVLAASRSRHTSANIQRWVQHRGFGYQYLYRRVPVADLECYSPIQIWYIF